MNASVLARKTSSAPDVPQRLLLAEDSPSDARLLKEALVEGGSHAELHVASTLSEALALTSATPVDVLLLDLGLPDSQGLPTLRTVLQRVPDVPVVVMTGRDDERIAQQALQEGAQDYLIKADWMSPGGGGRAVVRSLRYAVERHRILRELQEANRIRSMFVATASHELRTPLAIIQDYAGLLRDGTAGPLAGLQEECVGAIARNCDRLGALVNDLLDVAKMESGTIALRLEMVSIDDVLAECRADFARRCAEKGQRLELDIEPHLPAVPADRGRLTQVVVNLLANAHRFTPEGGTIRLRAARDGDQVRLEVADSGVGIPREELERIFEAFVQVKRRAGAGSGGTGLGLYLARRIVTMHGGTISADSEPGRGSRVHFTLPTASRGIGLASLRAALVALSGFTPGLVSHRNSVIWLGPLDPGASATPAARLACLREVEAAATALFRRHDAAFLCESHDLVACLIQGGEDDALGYLRRLARALERSRISIGYEVKLANGRAPDESASPPMPLTLSPLSRLDSPRHGHAPTPLPGASHDSFASRG